MSTKSSISKFFPKYHSFQLFQIFCKQLKRAIRINNLCCLHFLGSSNFSKETDCCRRKKTRSQDFPIHAHCTQNASDCSFLICIDDLQLIFRNHQFSCKICEICEEHLLLQNTFRDCFYSKEFVYISKKLSVS